MTVRRTHPPTRVMRESPDIDQLRRQARELLEAYRAQSPDAVLDVDACHRTATPDAFALHDAQFVLARAYGFESWPKRDDAAPCGAGRDDRPALPPAAPPFPGSPRFSGSTELADSGSPDAGRCHVLEARARFVHEPRAVASNGS
jgi:hypothetical protein